MFAWEKGKVISANIDTDEFGVKRYKINGTLFFGSVLNFLELFDVKSDASEVLLDLRYAKIMDYSAIEAIDSLAGRYAEVGKKLTISRVSHDCRLLFKNAEKITNIDIGELQEEENPFPHAHHPQSTFKGAPRREGYCISSRCPRNGETATAEGCPLLTGAPPTAPEIA